MLSPPLPLFPDAGPGRGEPKCAPDIGKPILLADAVVIIDYYLDNAASAQKGTSGPSEAWREEKRGCTSSERDDENIFWTVAVAGEEERGGGEEGGP